MSGFAEGRRTARDTALVGAVAATALAAAGRFRSAAALAVGTVVALLSVVWLAHVVERLEALQREAGSGLGRRFGMKAALRYGAAGLLLWGAVRYLPGEVPWLLAGVSTVVAALAAQAVAEAWRSRPGAP